MSGTPATAPLVAAAGPALIVASALLFSRTWLEATLIGHVLVQMPLLAFTGWLLGSAFEPRLDRIMERWNRFGVAGFTFAIFMILFWMLPRSIDSAVANPGYEMFKFVSLPCTGAALALSFPRSGPLFAGALKANVVSMLAVLAWVYAAAPVRLCNSYLGSDQKMLGAGMAVLAGALAIHWGHSLLFGASGFSPSGHGRPCRPQPDGRGSPQQVRVKTLGFKSWRI